MQPDAFDIASVRHRFGEEAIGAIDRSSCDGLKIRFDVVAVGHQRVPFQSPKATEMLLAKAFVEDDSLRFFVILAVGFYLRTPLLIYFWQRFQANPRMEQVDLRQLDSKTADYLATHANALCDIGFSEPTFIRLPSPVTGTNGNLIMLVNRETGDKAMITTLFGSPSWIKTFYVEFNTRFDTGEILNTQNSAVLPAFPPRENYVRTQVPILSDPLELYRLHCFVMKQAQVCGGKVIYEPGRALDYLMRSGWREPLEEQTKRGWLRYHSKTQTYRPTLRGTYLMTWGLMQPFKLIRTVQMRRRARKVLDEFCRASFS